MQCPYKQLRQITDTIQMPADQKTRTLQTKLCGQQCCLYERNCSISVRACVTRIPLTQSLKKRNRRATLESKKQQVHGDMAQKEFTVWHIRCFLHLVHWTVSLCSMTKKETVSSFLVAQLCCITSVQTHMHAQESMSKKMHYALTKGSLRINQKASLKKTFLPSFVQCFRWDS